jgi:hypothetical protein
MPRVKDPILTEKQIDKVSIAELRQNYRILIAHYKKKKANLATQQMINSKIKIDRETAVKKVTDKYVKTLTRIRINRDVRINKITWKLFKKDQRLYTLKKAIRKRLAPISGTRVKNKREVVKKARALGYQQGVSKSLRMRKQEIYRAGFKDGHNDYKLKAEQTRRGVIKRSATVDSIARTGLLINKLSKALGVPPEYVAIFLWSGEYESFFFYELKAAMEAVGDNLFYNKIYYLKEKGYLHRIAMQNKRVIWALTPLGREIYSRTKSFITKHIQEEKLQNESAK